MTEQRVREDRDVQLDRLRARVQGIQGRRIDLPVVPVMTPLRELFPERGLRTGSVYSVPSSSALLSALLVEPSRAGSWCAVIGIPDLGVESAAALGVNLSRVVLIPNPGSRWAAVLATLADVLPVVVVRPGGSVSDAYAARLAARLRERGTVLIVQGGWPGAEAVVDVSEPNWHGVGWGHGYLAERDLTVAVTSRRWMRPRRERVLLPTTDGTFRVAPGRDPEQGSETEQAGVQHWSADGERHRLEAVG